MSKNTPEYVWYVYKLFHDPPGTPKELKCVGCKVAVGIIGLGAAAANLYGVKKFVSANVYKGAAFGGLAILSVGFASVAFRMASDHMKYNEQLIAKFRASNKIIGQT